jgi:hypothetical protein
VAENEKRDSQNGVAYNTTSQQYGKPGLPAFFEARVDGVPEARGRGYDHLLTAYPHLPPSHVGTLARQARQPKEPNGKGSVASAGAPRHK